MEIRVACVIPTYNSRCEADRLLNSLLWQKRKFDVLVVDSSSNDGTESLSSIYGIANISVLAAEFNHGGTRQMMVECFPDYDVYVFMTQDAYLVDEDAIDRIVAPFQDESVGAVCGRQLPHEGAGVLATHARLFNYPGTSRVLSMAEVPRFGMKAAFISNSFAAYRGSALRNVGGFPRHVILSEDMYVVARMLLKGWKIAYEANARCRHSHDYTIAEEFRRYFDIGVFHARERWIRDSFGGASGEGLRYVLSELRYLGLRRLYLWPTSLLRNAAKLIAYRLAYYEKRIPVQWKRRLSMHRRYWDGPSAGTG